MSPQLIAQLIVTAGVPVANMIMEWIAAGKETVTPEMWEALKKQAQTPFADLAGPK